MPSLQALGLTNEKVGDVDFNLMPDQRGSFGPLPQPGTYRFKFPLFDAGSPIWDSMDAPTGRPGTKRINLKFEDAFALTIVQSPGNVHNGETFEARFSNREFNQAWQGEEAYYVSDLDYIFRDVLRLPKPATNNQQYAQFAIQSLAGKEMTADLEFTWYCNAKNDIRVDDGAGSTTVVEGQKGCGTKFYQGGKNGVQKAHTDANDPTSPLVFPERIGPCPGKDGVPCGASLRAFPRLRNYRA